MNGKILITIYGVNNLGKSLQVDMLKKRLSGEGMQVFSLKYPIYDLNPTGPRINAYLRKKNPEGLTPLEAQKIYVENRKDFARALDDLLNSHDAVIAEDYLGTGIAWGMGAGVDKKVLVDMNAELRKENLAILIDGERFMQGVEKDHAHESNNELTERVRLIHLDLAREFGWVVVKGNHQCQNSGKPRWLRRILPHSSDFMISCFYDLMTLWLPIK